jgi:hypothetical protein
VRLLLDECIDQRFARDIPGHDVSHVRALGWASLTNGALLRRAAERFDAFVTVDRGIAFRQDLRGLRLAVIVMRTKRNTRTRLALLVPDLLLALKIAPAGEVTWLPERR